MKNETFASQQQLYYTWHAVVWLHMTEYDHTPYGKAMKYAMGGACFRNINTIELLPKLAL